MTDPASPLKQNLTNEQRIIASIKSWVGGDLIGDDCALLSASQTLVSSDALVEGTHFLRDLMTLQEIGWKSAAVNLSDIAAMAGRPRYLFVTVCAPPDFGEDSFRQLYEGIGECARAYKTVIAGGDITSSKNLMLSLTVIGDVHESGCLKRSGAKVGDIVVVTGDFGASRAGLWVMQESGTGSLGGNNKDDVNARNSVRERHVHPLPRLCESWSMVRRTGSGGALMDASDGLADALVQITRGSNVGLKIDLSLVPVAPETKLVATMAGRKYIDWALYGGEDYELVGCMPSQIWEKWLSDGDRDNPFTAIGTVTADSAQQIELHNNGQPAAALDLSRCFQHVE